MEETENVRDRTMPVHYCGTSLTENIDVMINKSDRRPGIFDSSAFAAFMLFVALFC